MVLAQANIVTGTNTPADPLYPATIIDIYNYLLVKPKPSIVNAREELCTQAEKRTFYLNSLKPFKTLSNLSNVQL